MGALTEVHLSPSTRSTERAVGDPWVGFKIGQLRVGGRVVGAVRLGSSSDGGSVGVLEFHARGPSSIMESLREGVVVEVALRVVREVQSCSEGIVKRTGERSVTYREKSRHMVYVVGNESWTSGGAPGKWDEDEIVTLESIARSDVCKMCDRHLTETREWMELRIRVQGAELEQLRRMIVRRPRSAPFSTRFFSTHMVRCLTNEEMREILEGRVSLRLTRKLDKPALVSSVFLGSAITLATFGLASIALGFYAVRSSQMHHRGEDLMQAKEMRRDFYYARATLIGKEKSWVKQLLQDDSAVAESEWPALTKGKIAQQRITTEVLKIIPEHGVLLKAYGKAVNVSFHVNGNCTTCSRNAGKARFVWTDNKDIEIKPLLDTVALDATPEGFLKVTELRNICLMCLNYYYKKYSSTSPPFSLRRFAPSPADGLITDEMEVMGLISEVGNKSFISCGLPEDGEVVHTLEIESRGHDRWRPVALHKGVWTGCSAAPKRIIIG